MSDTNRLRLSYILETDYGVTPAGNLTDLRFTSEGLKQNTEMKASDEIRYDRQDADVFRTSVSGGGPLAFELSGGAFDDMMMILMSASAWSSPVTSTGTYGAANSTNSFTRASGSFITDGLLVGQWIYVTGFTNAANNGFFKIVSVGATSLVVTGYTTLVDEAGSGDESIVMGGQLINGTTLRSCTLEKAALDVAAGAYMNYPGSSLESGRIRVATGEAIGGDLTFLSAREIFNTTSVGSGYTAAPGRAVMEAIDHVYGAGVLEGGSLQPVTEFEFTITTGLRNRMQVGTAYAVSQGLGTFAVTGAFRQYFANNVIMAKYLANLPSSLAFIANDAAGTYRYCFEFPQVKYSDGERVAGGKNQDILVSVPWMAYRHATEGITARFTRWTV